MYILRLDFSMYIERIIYPVLVLGIGKRIGIWLQGCPHKCQGCINPELWEQQEKNNISVKKIIDNIQKICDEREVDGFTITGGDPFFQAEELSYFLSELVKFSKEILVYTGYQKCEIQSFQNGESMLECIDVLIDGKYVEEQNYSDLTLRGSANQKIYYKDEITQNKYKEYILQGRKLQNIYSEEYMLSLGIHNRRNKNE